MEKKIRIIDTVINTKEAIEGAGVRLHRGFGYFELPLFDPFLLFDDFSSENEEDFNAGFPLHPHRGIETVTYILKGDVTHRDSLGNVGTIGKGDIQWMKAGSGIVHEEMPHGHDGLIGFQLWVNLPQLEKMSTPRYQEIKANEIPTVSVGNSIVHVIGGAFEGVVGPVKDIAVNPTYFDITLGAREQITIPVPCNDTSFVYIISGALVDEKSSYMHGTILLHSKDGDVVTLQADSEPCRLLFISGTPLREPIAWHGPIVMNTEAEIQTALTDLRNGTFINTNVRMPH